MGERTSPLLKVSSIILMVLGIITLVGAGVILAGGGLLTGAGAVVGSADETSVLVGTLGVLGGAMVMMLGGLMAISGICYVVAGVMGKNAAKGKRPAAPCKIFGIVLMVFSLLGVLINIFTGSNEVAGYVSGLAGIVLLACYVKGAMDMSKPV